MNVGIEVFLHIYYKRQKLHINIFGGYRVDREIVSRITHINVGRSEKCMIFYKRFVAITRNDCRCSSGKSPNEKREWHRKWQCSWFLPAERTSQLSDFSDLIHQKECNIMCIRYSLHTKKNFFSGNTVCTIANNSQKKYSNDNWVDWSVEVYIAEMRYWIHRSSHIQFHIDLTHEQLPSTYSYRKFINFLYLLYMALYYVIDL